MADRKVPHPQVPNARSLQLSHLQPRLQEKNPHLVPLPLLDHHLHRPLADLCRANRLDKPPFNIGSSPHPLEVAARERLIDLGDILFFEVGARVDHPVAKLSIICHDQHPNRRFVKPTDSEKAIGVRAKKVEDEAGALFSSQLTAKKPFWFVQKIVDFLFLSKSPAVDADPIEFEIDLDARFEHGFAVDLDPSVEDHRIAGAP